MRYNTDTVNKRRRLISMKTKIVNQTLAHARYVARKCSTEYLTFWYVREVTPNNFHSWAHDSDDEKTVACFYCGSEMRGWRD